VWLGHRRGASAPPRGWDDEEISLSNDGLTSIEVSVDLLCASDFTDVFEVRGCSRAAERGEISKEAGEGSLRFAYRREGFRRETMVRTSGAEPLARAGCISFRVRLEPGEERTARVSVTPGEGRR
jgi:hypothetical protein